MILEVLDASRPTFDTREAVATADGKGGVVRGFVWNVCFYCRGVPIIVPPPRNDRMDRHDEVMARRRRLRLLNCRGKTPPSRGRGEGGNLLSHDVASREKSRNDVLIAKERSREEEAARNRNGRL
jgi:hypothetical protein